MYAAEVAHDCVFFSGVLPGMASTEAGAAPYPVVITLPSFVVPASTSVIVTQREKESL